MLTIKEMQDLRKQYKLSLQDITKFSDYPSSSQYYYQLEVGIRKMTEDSYTTMLKYLKEAYLNKEAWKRKFPHRKNGGNKSEI